MSSNLDPFSGLAKVIWAMHGLTPGVQYAILITFVIITGIVAFAYCYTH